MNSISNHAQLMCGSSSSGYEILYNYIAEEIKCGANKCSWCKKEADDNSAEVVVASVCDWVWEGRPLH